MIFRYYLVLSCCMVWVISSPQAQELNSDAVHLDWSDSAFVEFPDEQLSAFSNLQTLNLRGTGIREVKIDKCCQNLRTLNLSNNDLSVFPTQTFKLDSLRILDLSSNQISVMPEMSDSQVHWEILSLQSNRLETIPNWVTQLTSLREVNLRGKQLYMYSKQELKQLFGEQVRVLKSPNCKCD